LIDIGLALGLLDGVSGVWEYLHVLQHHLLPPFWLNRLWVMGNEIRLPTSIIISVESSHSPTTLKDHLVLKV
jgi:hypothetical protein